MAMQQEGVYGRAGVCPTGDSIEACDRLQNDKGKQLITALVNLVSAFEERMTSDM